MTKNFIVGGVPMDLPIMVGGGVCKTPASVLPYMRSDVMVGGVETGSYTPLARTGNEGHSLSHPSSLEAVERLGFGLNAFGMPNCGFLEAFSRLQSNREKHCKPLLINVAGFSPQDYEMGARLFDNDPFTDPFGSAMVMNMGCPNTENVPVAYDMDSMVRVLSALSHVGIRIPLWLKLSPYIHEHDRERLQKEHPEIDFSNVPVVREYFIHHLCDLIAQYPFVRAVILSNTLGNCIRYQDGRPVTTPNGGKAGLSGPIIRPISVGLVRDFRTLLPEEIDVIGCGGILHGDHAMEYFEAGAAGVQCTSGPFWHGDGPRWFSDLITESDRLQEYLSARM